MDDLKSQLQQAELNFVRKLGQLKYLSHLKKNQIVEDCPICNVQPDTKVCFQNKNLLIQVMKSEGEKNEIEMGIQLAEILI